jgi:hypothetical protein
MLQRAFWELHRGLDLWSLFRCNEVTFVDRLRREAAGRPVARLIEGLFGPERRLYKRWQQYSFLEQGSLHAQVARKSYAWLAACAAQLAHELSRALGRPVTAEQVLIDAPPRKREVQFRVDILDTRRQQYRALVDVSPVVKTLAETQFDDYVKRVRVFVDPELLPDLQRLAAPEEAVQRAITATPEE